MKKYLATLLILGFSTVADGFNIDKFMLENGLNLYDIDKIGSRQHFQNHRFVQVKNGKLTISLEGEDSNRMSYLEDGILYKGTNKGEWGGALSVTENSVTKEIMKGNIVHLLPIQDKLYVIEGLAHLDYSGGSISQIPNRKDPTKPQRITLLPDAPRLVYVDKTRSDYQPIIVVGPNSVMSLSPFNHLGILHWKAFWSHKLSPTSIVRYKKHYFIGLPHGVAVLPAPWGSQEIRFYADAEFNKRIDEFNKRVN